MVISSLRKGSMTRESSKRVVLLLWAEPKTRTDIQHPSAGARIHTVFERKRASLPMTLASPTVLPWGSGFWICRRVEYARSQGCKALPPELPVEVVPVFFFRSLVGLLHSIHLPEHLCLVDPAELVGLVSSTVPLDHLAIDSPPVFARAAFYLLYYVCTHQRAIPRRQTMSFRGLVSAQR